MAESRELQAGSSGTGGGNEAITEEIDVSDIPPEEAAMRIANLGKEQVHCGKKDCPESNAG